MTSPRSAVNAAVATLLLVLAAHSSYASTSVVIVKTSTIMIIAADSKAVTKGPSGSISTTTCKIREVDSTFYAVARIPFESTSGYDALKEAEQAIAVGGQLEGIATSFRKAILPSLSRALQVIKKEHPEDYKQSVRNSRVLDVMFARMEAGVPRFCVLYFSVREGGGETPTIGPVVQRCSIDGLFEMRPLGVDEPIGRVLREDPNIARRLEHEPSELARVLVSAAISDRPDITGPPIDVLEASAGGVRWLEAKPECRGRIPIVTASTDKGHSGSYSNGQRNAETLGLKALVVIILAVAGSFVVIGKLRQHFRQRHSSIRRPGRH